MFRCLLVSVSVLLPYSALAGGTGYMSVDTLASAVVTADSGIDRNSTQTGLSVVDGSRLSGGFAVFSSPDVIKTLQNLPGVASGTELLSGLFVHGGDGADNLFLLDGVPLYQVSHFAGLFSSFNPDMVNLRSPAFEIVSGDGTPYGSNAGLRRSGGLPFFFCDDRSSCDGVLSFAVSCAYVSDAVHDYGSSGKFGIAYMYRVRVYRLSPEFYRYWLARYSIDNDDLSSLGWAPSNFAYTNVVGGFGVLGAVCCLDFGWQTVLR